jgi:hypothetical protein
LDLCSLLQLVAIPEQEHSCVIGRRGSPENPIHHHLN